MRRRHCALGEPLNYLDDGRKVQQTLKCACRALRPGGILIFDARLPAAKPVENRVTARVGDDWACISFSEEGPAANRLVRRIITFRRHGRTYRRGEEIHELRLHPKQEISGWLRKPGF